MKPKANLCHFLLDNGTQCQNLAEKGKHLCELHSDRTMNDVDIYKVTAEHFRQDLSLFWTRANFYLIVQAGLLSVTAGSILNRTPGVLVSKPVNLLLCVTGLILSVFWFLVLRGSLFWISQWRAKIIEIDKAVSRFQAYATIETLLLKTPLLSPSRVTTYLPLLFIVGWIALGIITFLTT